MEKKCPHCGQSLSDTAFKCSRCKKWVPNELFRRLCDDDVKLIKNKNQANIISGLPLYGQFINMPVHMREPFGEIFLAEEKDFDWRAIVAGRVL